jgi:hypothetical protein
MESNVPFDLDRRRYWVVFFILISLMLMVGGFLLYRSEAGRIEKDKYQEIKAIADLKAGQLQQWRQERLADADSVAKRPFLKKGVENFLQSLHDPRLREDMETLLKAELAHSAYADALLLTTDGDILLSTGSRPEPSRPAVAQAIQASLSARGAVLSEFYRSQGRKTFIDSIAPVTNGKGRPIAMLVLRTDAEAFLYPLIQSWPTPSRTAETLLVRRDGKEVLFLNELRHRAETALTLRYPLTDANVPAVQAVLGKQGMFRGKDYRNQEVLADLCPITGSPWFMVAKVDT